MNSINARFMVERHNFSLDVQLKLPGQGVCALFGASGSGKTTCLRAMAGLEKLPNSYFAMGDTVWQDSEKGIFVPPHQRNIGYVFQEASLFAHLNVRDNLNFGRRHLPPSEQKVNFDQICTLLGLTALLDRPPTSLSGGECQRVAIARALLTSPQLLLMDEPLSALDNALKQEVLPYLQELQQALSIPIIYVSHSSDEVAQLADHIVLIKHGKVINSGPLTEVMLDLSAGAIFNDGGSSLLTAEIVAQQNNYLTKLAIGPLPLWVAQLEMPIHSKLRCKINARDVSLCLTPPTDSSIINLLAAKITHIVERKPPGECIITLKISATHSLLAAITYASKQRLNLQIGDSVWAQIKAVVIL
ncbi:MAG: molybdate transport system ATP-binding protein [Psychromonas sp.]|jgi:molybdate transport system ATP-binding protein|uniref:molybdenum ABC transporter ATP-binding protein n=1 Tax=Psychromonas sp. TaxID=1884585 RepID=UPI0039E404B3